MTEKNKKPQIRFKGFTDDWEEREIGEIINDLYNGQTPSRIIDSYWNGHINWLSSGELNRSVVKETIEKITSLGMESAHLRIVPSGTFVMAITGLEASGTRGNCAILGIDTTLNQSCMAVYPNPQLLDSHFLFQWYRKNSEEYGVKFTQGTKQQSYNAQIIKKLGISLPRIEEQQKIASFLDNIDSLIILRQRKHDKLVNVKKSMLEKMFPKNGANVPEIRFKGFNDIWVQSKVGDYYYFKNGLNKGKEFFGKGIPIVNFTDVFHNRGINALDLKGKVDLQPSEIANYEVQKGDIFFTRTSETIDEIGYPSVMLDEPKDTVFSGFVLRGRAIEDDPLTIKFKRYVFYTDEFRKEMIKKSSMTTRALTSGTAIKQMEFYFPKDKHEQDKIGDFFQELDNLIALQHRELEKLKNIKKACLEKMFV